MDYKIAVLLDEDANISTSEVCMNIGVYEKIDGSWTLTRKHPIDICGTENIATIRNDLQSAVGWLADCNILIGLSVTGLIYYTFEKMKIMIYEIRKISDALLDEIVLEMDELGKENTKSYHYEPVETEIQGHYFLDLIALQEKNPEISSKQALKPFMQKKSFQELELICYHLPPWIKEDLDLSIQIVAWKGVIKVTINTVLRDL